MYSLVRARIGCLAMAAAAAACPLAAGAEGFAADYDLNRMASPSGEGFAGIRVDWNAVRITPAAALGGDASGAGLSVQAGRNWFGQVELAQTSGNGLTPVGTTDVVNVAGGYRWGNGQTLSLQLSRGRGIGQRLGLAVNYDWPRYFVRLSYDQGLNLAPQEGIRFSAGVRF
jgi:hypothetical protein